MIAAQFDYVRANTLDEALTLLAQNEDAKILAGGHSLIPAMKLRLAQPPLLIDLGRLKDLSYIREEGGQIRLGAMTTHYEIESSDLLKKICPLLPECAGHIGDVQVRNKGTIGGSLAHSDPAGDWPAAIIALNADKYVPGHGDLQTKDDVKKKLDLVTARRDEIAKLVKAGKSLDEVKQALGEVDPPPANPNAPVVNSFTTVVYNELKKKS